MLDMEISIKWNVCRVCLAEEKANSSPEVSKGGGGSMRHIFSDAKLAEQIYDCSGVKMTPKDNMPDKICRQCLMLLKYAVHFSTTCRNSDEYLQSVIQKTQSATSMLKLDQRRERTLELVDEIFNEDEEMRIHEHQSLVEVLCSNSVDDDQEGEEQAELLEVIGDSAKDATKHTEIGLKFSHTQTSNRDLKGVENVAAGDDNMLKKADDDTTPNMDHMTFNNDSALIEHKSSNEELVELLLEEQEQEDVDENDMEEMEEHENKKVRYRKTTSECSIEDDGYMEDDEEEHGTLEFINEPKAFDIEVSKEQADVDEETEGQKLTKAVISADNTVEDDEDGSYFYVLDKDGIKQEFVDMTDECDSLGMDRPAIDVLETNRDGGGDGDGDGDDNVDEVNTAKTSYMTAAAGEPFEEYLVDECAEPEECSQPELEVKNARSSSRSSSVTIKVGGRRWSPHTRKKVGDVYVYICDVCGNQFTSRSLMNYHMRIHRNEKNYECELCFKRFAAACNLTAHMRIHTGERPYECKFCQRRFTDRSTHIKHERSMHTNEKPFQCTICGKSFSLSTTLRTHEKVHTGEKPYKCVPCNKSFTLLHQLKAHLNTNQHKCIAMEKDLLTHNII